jgi:hypothetical protein
MDVFRSRIFLENSYKIRVVVYDGNPYFVTEDLVVAFCGLEKEARRRKKQGISVLIMEDGKIVEVDIISVTNACNFVEHVDCNTLNLSWLRNWFWSNIEAIKTLNFSDEYKEDHFRNEPITRSRIQRNVDDLLILHEIGQLPITVPPPDPFAPQRRGAIVPIIRIIGEMAYAFIDVKQLFFQDRKSVV